MSRSTRRELLVCVTWGETYGLSIFRPIRQKMMQLVILQELFPTSLALPSFARGHPSLVDYRSGVYWARHCLAYRLRGVRPLLKDPIAVFSAEWLAETFGAQVVVLIRHPAAFADSLNRAGWNYDFSNFLRQPLLMERYLYRFADEIRAAAAQPMDILDQASLLWRAIYHTVYEYQQAHPAWYFVRHEDLSLDPIAEFRRLFGYLDLPFSTGR